MSAMDAATLDAETLDRVLACERRIVNAWPAPSTLLIDDYVVRFANGYSGRANSASPLLLGAELDDETLDLIEQLYRADGLPPCIRLTPLTGEATRQRVLDRGYTLKDASFGMIADLSAFAPEIDPDMQIEAMPGRDWIQGVAMRQPAGKTDADHLAAIVETVRLPAAYATLLLAGEAVAYGMSVAERGMAEIGSVVVDAGHRGHGLGRRLVTSLMGWAKLQGSRETYLQVARTNAAAIGLYESLGFTTLYGYETMILA